MIENKNIDTRITHCIKEKNVAVFDLDGTLVKGDLGETLFFTLLMLRAKKLSISEIDKLPEMLIQEDFVSSISETREMKLLELYAQLLKNKQFNLAYDITNLYIENFGKSKIIEASLAVLRAFSSKAYILEFDNLSVTFFVKQNEMILSYILRLLQEDEVITYIVSASPQIVIDSFCQIFKLENVKRIGVSFNEPIIPYGKEKVKILNKNKIYKWELAFGNSSGDLQMLLESEFAVLCNPKEKSLIKIAEEQNWEVI